ncbi:YidC/Oxa1 family membrane protein insertase [Sediminihabitans luteus]|uniref:Membrane protein insertase YidC n=1 Tax=Sediminihabitans luteus TaxID=1138585 RepID=A0A2M9CCV8_9CELL|nr:membrane protein insertase YidC [Sediminihabitans luteus]PJJ69143.1 YidC/Oxa1 family membrane protein insertase [Sediminihabitans luteus]GII98815.1 hypothetical protein Slu03_11930 [Sediminihabitans luteus]
MDFFSTILFPIEWVVAWIMYLCHQVLLFIGFQEGPSFAWVLSIVGLVIIIRIILIPLFFKQIKASRGMQMIQPEMKAIQNKYKNKKDPASREAMSRETMELYRKHGTNPFASCLPILAQSPIFFALFRVLHGLEGIANGTAKTIGPINQDVASDIEQSSIFGAKLSDVFLQTDDLQVKLVIAGLILAMVATTFFTQRQLTMKNMPKAALEGPAAQTQKMMLYAFPLIFAISGVNFPVGVLVYWTTTNLWSMGQQFYTIRKMPAPGSEAEKALKARQAKKAAAKGITLDEGTGGTTAVIEQPRGQRQQPKRKNRQKPAGQQRPAGSSGGSQTASTSGTPAADGAASGGSPADASGSAEPAGTAKPSAKAKPAGNAKPGGGANGSSKGSGSTAGKNSQPKAKGPGAAD